MNYKDNGWNIRINELNNIRKIKGLEQDSESVNRKIWSEIRKDVIEELESKGVAFEWRFSLYGFSYYDNGDIKNGRNHQIELSEYLEHSTKDDPINDIDCMTFIHQSFHEYEHLKQAERFKYTPDFSEDAKNYARLRLIHNYFPAYYDANYKNNISEIDAEVNGIESSIKYVREKYPWVDIEKGIVGFVKDCIKSNDPITSMYTKDESYSSCGEIIEQLRERKRHLSRVKLSEIPQIAPDTYESTDENLRKILNGKFEKKYEKCGSVEEKDKLLVDEIIKLYPEELNEFPVLESDYMKMSLYTPSKFYELRIFLRNIFRKNTPKKELKDLNSEEFDERIKVNISNSETNLFEKNISFNEKLSDIKNVDEKDL